MTKIIPPPDLDELVLGSLPHSRRLMGEPIPVAGETEPEKSAGGRSIPNGIDRDAGVSPQQKSEGA